MKTQESCLICKALSHGVHFQVLCCRACSVFFRRTISASKIYKCRRATKNCKINVGDPLMCRYCRYQKCLKVGMRLSDTSDVFETCNQNVIVKSDNLIYDAHSLIEKLKKILLKPLKNASNMTFIEEHLHSYFWLRVTSDAKTLQAKSRVSIDESISCFEEAMCNIAKWMMVGKDYASLQFSDKWLLFKNVWQVAYTLSTIQNTMAVLGSNPDDSRLIFGKYIVDKDLVYEMPVLSKAKAQKYDKFMREFDFDAIEGVAKYMKRIQMTDYELTFILLNSLWNVDTNNDVRPETQELSKKIQQQITDEIHGYYVNDLKQATYAQRLSKLLRLQMHCEIAERLKKDKFIVASIFGTMTCVEVEKGLF
ncbi:hypothetical protein L596_011913 [Steinernema carpocapsae]|uniref:Nuclear receptor domain-containing protein n=1 Tax=Steinernema carpocapsae TaxID=34508 RepID=A0A4U5NVF5_STECR|nr:hypothetical protein L596_011913 [Steinernema carpocapsae]